MSKKKLITLVCVFSVILTNIMGCSKIEEVKDKSVENMIVDSELPQYNLDKRTYDNIYYNDKVYVITNEEIDFNLIEEPIAKVDYVCTLDENKKEISKDELRKIDLSGTENNSKREYLKFGWIHEIKDINSNDEIAININSSYYKCKLKK